MSPDIARSSPALATETAPERSPRRRSWRTFAVVAASVAYPFLVYRVLAQPLAWPRFLLTFVALGALCASLPPGWTRRSAILGALALIAVAAVFAATSSLLFLPPVCVNLGLAWLFGHTLAPGREALITRFARLRHAPPDASVVGYTRRLTRVWTVFFVAMAAASGALATFGAHAAWVWFTAVGNYLCAAMLFAVEYAIRRWKFPHHERISPAQQIAMMRTALRNRHE